MSLFLRLFRLLKNVYNFFCWNIFRPCFDFFYRKIFRYHIIERAALANDVKWFCIHHFLFFINCSLDQIVMKSKDLPQIQQYFMEEIYTQQRLDRSIVDELYSKKHIPRTKKYKLMRNNRCDRFY